MKKIYFVMIIVIFSAVVAVSSCASDKTPPNKFAGNYAGTFGGDSSGTWTAEIKKDGAVTAVMSDPDVGNFKLTGTINPDGKFGLGVGKNQISRVSWEGSFKIENGNCTGSGTWKSSTGPSGTWEGSRIGI